MTTRNQTDEALATREDLHDAQEAPDPARRRFVLGVLGGLGATALLTACEGDGGATGFDAGGADGTGGAPDTLGGGPDGAGDAATLDSAGDAAPDTGTDVGPDAGVDVGAPDAGTDVGPDAGADVGAPDAGIDVGEPDAGIDAGDPDAGAHCTLYPEQTAGPFYLDLDLVRRDVTEGKPGAPLRLTIRVLGADGCVPLRDVAVEIWHCDADGVYSGFPGQLGGLDTTGERFLRGTQFTGDDGRAVFDTIYPGWYPGRTTHIHFRVRPSATTQATSQLYFPEDVNEAVYAVAPYAARGQKDTANTADGVVRTSGLPPLALVTADGAAYTASLTVTVAG